MIKILKTSFCLHSSEKLRSKILKNIFIAFRLKNDEKFLAINFFWNFWNMIIKILRFFSLRKNFYHIIDTSDLIKNYIIFLLEKYLEQDKNFIEYFQILWDFYLNGLSFLDYFLDYWMDENMDYSLSENEKPKILKLISDLKSWKYYNFDLDDDNDWKNYKWTNISILSAHCHRYTYDEK